MKPFTPILVPGSPLSRVSAQRRSRVRTMVLVVVAIGVFVLTALLIQSCIHAHAPATGESIAASNALASGVTTNVSGVVRSPVTVSNVESNALLATAPVVTQTPAPLLTMQAPTVKNYSVVSSDTFSKIAKANGVSVSALAKANPGVDPAKLKIGQVLHIPGASQKQALRPSNAAPASVKDKQ